MIEGPTRWAVWRPIGYPVYEFVSAGRAGFSMQDVIDEEREEGRAARAARAYWWPWSEEW